MRDSLTGAELWARTGRVQLAGALLASIIGGRWAPMGEAEACASGMWVHKHPTVQGGDWDDGGLEIIAGSREEGRRLRGWLGEPDVISGGGKKLGNVNPYFVDRYGFDPGTTFFLVYSWNAC